MKKVIHIVNLKMQEIYVTVLLFIQYEFM